MSFRCPQCGQRLVVALRERGAGSLQQEGEQKDRPQPSLRDKPSQRTRLRSSASGKNSFVPMSVSTKIIRVYLPAASRPRLSRYARLWLIGSPSLRQWLGRCVALRRNVAGRQGGGLQSEPCCLRFCRPRCGRGLRGTGGCGLLVATNVWVFSSPQDAMAGGGWKTGVHPMADTSRRGENSSLCNFPI